jgi:hypothetical protein
VSEIFEGKAATIAALQAQLEEAHRENEVLRGAVAALAAQVGVVAAGDADTDSAAATSSPAPPPAATPRVPSRGGVDDDRDAGRCQVDDVPRHTGDCAELRARTRTRTCTRARTP